MMKECLPKVRIKILKISNVILCFLTFCSSDRSLLSFLNFKFLNILVNTIHFKKKSGMVLARPVRPSPIPLTWFQM